MEELAPGHRLGSWTVESRVGAGGSGTVYRVRRSSGSRLAAAKVLHIPIRDAALALERARREAGLLMRLSHPRIARLLDILIEERRIVLVSQMAAGKPLDRMVQNTHVAGTGFPVAAVLRVARDLAEALSYLHGQAILHRDVKPGNIVVDGRGHAKLVDLGLARLVAETTLITDPGRVRVTLRYTAPEILLKQFPGPTADLYALGLVIHELLAGRPAFPQTSLAAVATAQLTVDPPAPSRLRPRLSVWWDRLVSKLIMKEPSRRYASATALLADLDELSDDLRVERQQG